MIAELGLALALAVQEPPRTVALVFDNGSRTVTVSVTEAEKELARLETVKHHARTVEQKKRYAALVQALGVKTSDSHLIACADLAPDRHKPLCETLRGRRLPLQRN